MCCGSRDAISITVQAPTVRNGRNRQRHDKGLGVDLVAEDAVRMRKHIRNAIRKR